MRRPVLLTLAAVGGVIVLLGGTGVFAALTDTARSGTNSIETDALAGSSDLRIAELEPAVQGMPMPTCGPFSDDLTSPLFTITGQVPAAFTERSYCLRNVGSQWVSLTVSVDDVLDEETGCTGDEVLYDESCGSGLGEVAGITTVLTVQKDCGALASGDWESRLFGTLVVAPFSLGQLGPGETRCFGVAISQAEAYPPDLQLAQSDRLTWRFAWTGQA